MNKSSEIGIDEVSFDVTLKKIEMYINEEKRILLNISSLLDELNEQYKNDKSNYRKDVTFKLQSVMDDISLHRDEYLKILNAVPTKYVKVAQNTINSAKKALEDIYD